MTRNRKALAIIGAVVAIGVAVWLVLLRAPSAPKVYAVTVVKTLPHDSGAFTEGLFLQGGKLYESTGPNESAGETASSMRRSNLDSGEIELQQDLQSPYFGEGIIAWKDRLVQLTWQHHIGFVYNLSDFTPRDQFSYTGEGWGLTQDGKRIIMSDGTATLRFLDPETMKQTGTLDVTSNGCPVKRLNELEWVDGEIYANIWQTNLIARIDPATGKVNSFLDVSALGPHSSDVDAVPNGIAYDAGAKRLFVTGKLWPQLYEVRAEASPKESDEAKALSSCGK